MKQYLAEVKKATGPYKSVSPNVRFRMENSLQEFVKSKNATQEAYRYEHLYSPSASQFERNMSKCEEEVQEMKNPMTTGSRKRKKSIMNKYFSPKTTQGT